MTDLNDKTLNELKTLSAFFAQAEDDMRAGKVVDLSDIDDRVAAVCEAVQIADKKAHDVYLPIMSDLLKKLNSCEVTMHSLHHELSEEE